MKSPRISRLRCPPHRPLPAAPSRRVHPAASRGIAAEPAAPRTASVQLTHVRRLDAALRGKPCASLSTSSEIGGGQDFSRPLQKHWTRASRLHPLRDGWALRDEVPDHEDGVGTAQVRRLYRPLTDLLVETEQPVAVPLQLLLKSLEGHVSLAVGVQPSLNLNEFYPPAREHACRAPKDLE